MDRSRAQAQLPVASSRAVCRRNISVTASGVVRTHGLVSSRCPGSRQLPAVAILTAPPPPPQRGSDGNPAPPPPTETLPPKCTVRIIKRIPKASREAAGRRLASIIDSVVTVNDHASWDCLLRFSQRCLRLPSRGGRHKSGGCSYQKAGG